MLNLIWPGDESSDHPSWVDSSEMSDEVLHNPNKIHMKIISARHGTQTGHRRSFPHLIRVALRTRGSFVLSASPSNPGSPNSSTRLAIPSLSPSPALLIRDMAESSSEILRPKIPCNCPRASKCSRRCYVRLPTLTSPLFSPISYSDKSRLKQHIREAFDNLHGFFLSTITPTSYIRNSGPPSLSLPSTSSTATTSADITNPSATRDLPNTSSAITDQTLQTLHSILSRAHSRNQTLNSFTSSEDTSTDDTSTDDTSTNTSTNKPKIPLTTFTALYTSLITDHELFLTDLAPYYREEWAEGEVRKLMAEFVGEVTSGEKKLRALIGRIITADVGEGEEGKGG